MANPHLENPFLILIIFFVNSVSDLLDYINPSPDAGGRDTMGARKRNYLAKVDLILVYPSILSLHEG